MKKLIAIFSAMLLVCSFPMMAYAAEPDTRTTTVSLTVDESLESYTLTIPSEITIDPATKKGACDVSLTDVTLVWSNSIDVKMTPKNADETGIYLVNTDDSEKKIAYKITDINNKQVTTWGDSSSLRAASASWDTGKTNVYAKGGTLAIEVLGAYPGSGTYTDTWTFTVTVS